MAKPKLKNDRIFIKTGILKFSEEQNSNLIIEF